MPKVESNQQKIIIALESRSPKSLTEVYHILGGAGKLSGSIAKKMRELVPGIEERLASNKAGAGTAKSEGSEIQLKSKPAQKADKKPAKAAAKTNILRHPKNPFRVGSSYGLLVDLLASVGPKGIGKPDLIKAYSSASGKDETHCRYDLAVILSASTTAEKMHRSCRSGFSILREGDHLRIRFD